MHDCTVSLFAHLLAVFQATGKELLAVSRSAVVIWGIVIGLACCMCTGGELCHLSGLDLMFDLVIVTSCCLSRVVKQVLACHVFKHGAIMLLAEWPQSLVCIPHVSHVRFAFAVRKSCVDNVYKYLLSSQDFHLPLHQLKEATGLN